MVWVKSKDHFTVRSGVKFCGFGTSVVFATRAHLAAKARIVTVPAPSLVISRLIALSGGVLHLALTGAARGCTRG
jgi:hypothetical protein